MFLMGDVFIMLGRVAHARNVARQRIGLASARSVAGVDFVKRLYRHGALTRRLTQYRCIVAIMYSTLRL